MGKSYAIDRRETVQIGGVPQSLRIRGQSAANPLLLFLHGGPGVCDRHWVLANQSGLADAFTLCCWDQRGAGLSYDAARAKTEELTIARMVEDAREVAEYLCRAFGKEQLFVVGHSWGSVLGVLLAQRYPQRIAAYIGMGQVANGPENERISYEFVWNEAQRRGDAKAQAELRRIGAPRGGLYGSLDDLMVQRNYMTKYGGGDYGRKSSLWASMVWPLLCSPEYGPLRLSAYAHGAFYSLRQLWSEVAAVDFWADVPALSMPVYITQGRHDQNTPPALARRWFDALNAPRKEWVWFENSAHSPIKEEPALWQSTVRRLLAPDA